MKNKLILYLIFAVFGLVGLLSIQTFKFRAIKDENKRLNNNQTALLDQSKIYKVKIGSDSLTIAKSKALKLELNEVKQYRSQDAAIIKDLGVKLKYAQAVAKNAIKTENNFTAPVKDSIVYMQGKNDTIRCVAYKDKWFEFNGCIDNQNRFIGRTSSVDTLVGVVHVIPKRFLFFRYGVKAVEFVATNKNPNSKIYFQEYYEINH